MQATLKKIFTKQIGKYKIIHMHILNHAPKYNDG